MTASQYLWNIWCYAKACVVCIGVGMPLLILLWIIPESKRYESYWIYRLTDLFYCGILWACSIRMHIIGTTHHHGPAIYAANHASSLDIPVLGAVVGMRAHIWYALASFFQYPILGFFLKRMAIPVDQERPLAAARALKRGIERAQKYHLSSLIFPEGGRYCDGMIRPFHAGIGKLACTLKQPVIPVYLGELNAILPPKAYLILTKPWRHRTITVHVGPPLVCASDESETAFAERVRQWFATHSPLSTGRTE